MFQARSMRVALGAWRDDRLKLLQAVTMNAFDSAVVGVRIASIITIYGHLTLDSTPY